MASRINSVSGLIRERSTATSATVVTNNMRTRFEFGIVDGNDAFFGFLDALQEHRVAKILAEPNIVAVSGRPAQFNVGGEFPILDSAKPGHDAASSSSRSARRSTSCRSCWAMAIFASKCGRGSAKSIRQPASVGVTFDIPALTVRQVDTAVEMKAGQTFALAGLVQERTESLNRGLPYLSDLPIIGVPFRRHGRRSQRDRTA